MRLGHDLVWLRSALSLLDPLLCPLQSFVTRVPCEVNPRVHGDQEACLYIVGVCTIHTAWPEIVDGDRFVFLFFLKIRGLCVIINWDMCSTLFDGRVGS